MHLLTLARLFLPAVVFAGVHFSAAIADAAEFKVDRISPPSWWATAEPERISLLIEGRGLDQGQVRSRDAALRIDRVEPGLEGRALVVDVTIAAGAQPGPIELEIEAGAERTLVEWQLVARPKRRPQPIGPDDVIYLIMPDRFANGDPTNDRPPGEEPMLDRGNREAYHGGDFRGIRERLAYLVDLGVTAIWLTPVYQQDPGWRIVGSGDQTSRFAPYHGYAPVDFYKTNPRFGSLAEYGQLVAEAHRLGLKVIQDQIVGYTGPEHPWVKQPPAENWFHGSVEAPTVQTLRFEALANKDATDAERRGVIDGWYMGFVPDLATENPRVRQYAIQQSLWWTVLGVADGVRLDTFPMVERDFWRDWDRRLKSVYPNFVAVGEAWTNDPKVLSFFQGGRTGWDGIDPGVAGVFDFPLHVAIATVFTNRGPASLLAKALAADSVCPRPDLLVTFLDNHDMSRLSQCGTSPGRVRIAAAFLLSTRGIPQITWGDEIGLAPGEDHRRGFPGGFPGDLRDAFTAAGRTAEEQELFDTWRTLLHLRQKTPAMRRGRLTDLAVGDKTYAYLREHQGERVMTVLNLDDKPISLSVSFTATGTVTRQERLYGNGTAKVGHRQLDVEVPAESAAIFRLMR